MPLFRVIVKVLPRLKTLRGDAKNMDMLESDAPVRKAQGIGLKAAA